MAAGDLDGDGQVDLAYRATGGGQHGNRGRVCLNDGDGGFRCVALDHGSGPRSRQGILLADLRSPPDADADCDVRAEGEEGEGEGEGQGGGCDEGDDLEGDGLCAGDDADDDNDGVADELDPAPADPTVCGDSDGDSCDDCSVGRDGMGPQPDARPEEDGPDLDGDGICDAGDLDRDNDGVPGDSDPADDDPARCGDSDEDGCDDCDVGQDGLGPLPDWAPWDDGCDEGAGDVDSDGDGLSDDEEAELGTDPNAPEPDDDGDGVASVVDNCGHLGNSDQADSDGDGIGDLCDPNDGNEVADKELQGMRLGGRGCAAGGRPGGDRWASLRWGARR